ncbi:hypothetical protein [Nocardioides alpinus]|nr:hypothetical protein [Nocardioides alpinus]PKH44327.1 hypothetical protein CXG46_01910 [Nocardioides alpinus]
MGHPRRHAGRAFLRTAGSVVAVAALVSGCQDGAPDDPPAPGQQSAALRVETVAGAEQLDERTRADLEAAVGDVLSAYVLEAFLGDFPREEFVRSFESFTSRAASSATRDIDLLTAAGTADATAVRATDLDARLSFLTQSGTAHSGTAAVHFAFEATLEDGTTQALVLDGRFLLEADRDTWSIFGYDVAYDDGLGVPVETESTP